MQKLLFAALFSFLLLPAHLASAAQHAPPIGQLLQNMVEATDMQLQPMGFQQHISIRALLFSWQFVADVERQGERLVVDVGPGAPFFVPDDLSAALIDFVDEVQQFDLTIVDENTDCNGRLCYIVEGERKKPKKQGVQSGTLWVDAENWLIVKANMTYPWGKLDVDQEYRATDGRIVLHRQQAVTQPLGAKIEVRYKEYWFESP